MNLKDYTNVCLKNINKRVQCIRPKPITNSDTGKYLDFEDCRVGQKFVFSGFVCALDEFSVMLEDLNGYMEIISHDEFLGYFKFLN